MNNEQTIEKNKDTRVLLSLMKSKKTYKMVIPEKVEDKIRFLCDKIHEVEWSGTLFYKVEGTFENDDLVVTCVDLYLMDIGSAAYTEFNMSPDVISYMADTPELLDCKTGLIHSHNNMSTFFSGTDTSTLQEEGTDRNHFVSLIVNNEGTYTAGITQKVTYEKDINETASSSTYGGLPVTHKQLYKENAKKIVWYEFDIEKHSTKVEHKDLDERIAEIKKKKIEARPVVYGGYGGYKWSDSFMDDNPTRMTPGLSKSSPYFSQHFQPSKQPKQGNLFKGWDDWDDEDTAIPFKEVTLSDKKKNKSNEVVDIPYAGTYSQQLIERAAKQLITGSYLCLNEESINLKFWVKNMPALYKERFGNLDIPECKSAFENWAEIMTQYVLENDLDPAFVGMDEDEEISKKAFDLAWYLDALEDEKNEYLSIIIESVTNWIQ